MTSTALTVIERAKAALGVTDKVEQELRELAAGTVTITKITNADGREQVHAARMVLKNRRVDLEKDGKGARDDATQFSKAVIAEEKRLIGLISGEEQRLQGLQEAWDAARAAEKQAKIDAELKRITDLQARVVKLRGNQTLTASTDPALIAKHIDDITAISIDASFEEFQQPANDAKVAGLARLRDLHTAALAHAAEQERIVAERAELAKLRAAEEERQAAERQRLADEERRAKEAREAQEAEMRAARERQEAEAAAERKRLADDRAAFEREQADARRVREQEEAAAAERSRIANLQKPDDSDLIDVLSKHYRAPASKVVEWILAMDLSRDVIDLPGSVRDHQMGIATQ